MDFLRILNVAGYLLIFLEAQPLDTQVIDVSTLSEKAQNRVCQRGGLNGRAPFWTKRW